MTKRTPLETIHDAARFIQNQMLDNAALTISPPFISHQQTITPESLYTWLGRSWYFRIKRRQQWAGTYAVAKQLRKQGVGIVCAKLILLGRV